MILENLISIIQQIKSIDLVLAVVLAVALGFLVIGLALIRPI